MEQQENILTSLGQYRSEVLRLPRLTESEERDLEQRARLRDEQAHQQLIESCLQYVARIAWRYLCYVRQDYYLDLVIVGNLAVVEGIAKALTAAKLGAYLRGVARHAIRRYCLARSSLVNKNRRLPKER